MPYRRLAASPPIISSAHRHHTLLLAVAVSASTLLLLALLVLLFLLYLYLSRRSPTLPFPSSSSSSPESPIQRFSYRALRAATASFDASRSIGRGASAAVFRGILPDGKSVAVKRLFISPSSSPSHFTTSDREFHNELHVLAALRPSPFIVSLIGYCLEGRRRRLLVHEYMPNGSLQEALFISGSTLSWDRRFSIVLDVAQALAFLHLECDPPVVHGDIKPSNVLLGFDFQAKLSDFGLSRLKTDADLVSEFFSQDLRPSQELFQSQDLIPESPQVHLSFALRASSSKNLDSRQPADGTSPVQDEIFSFEPSKESAAASPLDDERSESSGPWGKQWWWKQDESGELSSKDYVKEWIGSQIGSSGNPDWDFPVGISPDKSPHFSNNLLSINSSENNADKKQNKKNGVLARDRKDKRMREWWKEEYFAELSKKGHCKKGPKWFRTISSRGEESTITTRDDFSRRDRESKDDLSFRKGWKKKKKKRSRSAGSDMFSGDLFSRELSSTTSMRGTVCYIAPECHRCDQLMEKADIYSFGVLILVIVSGRRPLHVLSSPVKLEKANLVSWCRLLAQSGNPLELVDERLKGSFNKEQATLCINVALLCLQRIPELRPDAGDIVKILKGEMELPVLPCEFSPSPPLPPPRCFSRSRPKPALEVEQTVSMYVA